jgi:hypothetical protein
MGLFAGTIDVRLYRALKRRIDRRRAAAPVAAVGAA